jgi:hypothetical protein
MFAAMQWWRGSFWMMAPLMLVFATQLRGGYAQGDCVGGS